MVNRLLVLLFLAIGAAWLVQNSADGDRIQQLEREVEAAQSRVEALEGQLDSAKAEYMAAINNVEATNGAINAILDDAGRNIDVALTGIQKLKAINTSYDRAVHAVRDKCGSAIRRAGTDTNTDGWQ